MPARLRQPPRPDGGGRDERLRDAEGGSTVRFSQTCPVARVAASPRCDTAATSGKMREAVPIVPTTWPVAANFAPCRHHDPLRLDCGLGAIGSREQPPSAAQPGSESAASLPGRFAAARTPAPHASDPVDQPPRRRRREAEWPEADRSRTSARETRCPATNLDRPGGPGAEQSAQPARSPSARPAALRQTSPVRSSLSRTTHPTDPTSPDAAVGCRLRPQWAGSMVRNRRRRPAPPAASATGHRVLRPPRPRQPTTHSRSGGRRTRRPTAAAAAAVAVAASPPRGPQRRFGRLPRPAAGRSSARRRAIDPAERRDQQRRGSPGCRRPQDATRRRAPDRQREAARETRGRQAEDRCASEP